ncbi:membrane protein [Streptomyces spiroverticillatus]|uniref:Membrane protein n=1 Tax=Streptomyces finlayi TaxID=67296 RepID=A0A918WUL3_9ACTN|nr:YcnI family protein [Streptomyces finlayi]GGZ99751.1 membrane protein [Streptomyces spiroverticillatus]GHC84411.1 membrane protein [Streptomyces finlayi]
MNANRRTRISRLSAVGVAAAASVVVLAGPAFAHVSVQPVGAAAKGGYATVNVKVPNERDNASTVQLEVSFPVKEHPLTSVMPQAVPGWTVKVEKTTLDKPLKVHGKEIKEAVSKITWTGGKIGPGEFQQFPLSLGQLPEDADQLVLKAIQTYDNKEVVRWIEEPKEGQPEPQSPAPVLKLTAPVGDGHGAAATDDKKAKDSTASDKHDDGKKETASAASASDTTARVLGIVGIIVGVAGVAFGVLAGRRRAS